MVPWTRAIWRFRAAAGGAPYVLTICLSLVSAWRDLPMRRRRFSAGVSVESSQMPSHLVASRAKWTI